ncbi:hypothetical protein WJX81_006081 [Elliptochloris bilobata]|uniref:Uncharacterized protein n=1 Tax=Elliptochloris bilobata TaxID=381761 RepID=A0AAW1SHI9_9CHLO
MLPRGSALAPEIRAAEAFCKELPRESCDQMAGLFACFRKPKVAATAPDDGEEVKLGPDGLAKGSPLGSRREGSPFKRDGRTATAITAAANSAPNSGVELANARALVRALVRKPESRRFLSKLMVLDGREKMESWWVDEGYLTDLSNVLEALEEAKTRDRLFIASKYQLFTLNQVRQAVKAAEDAAEAASAAAAEAESSGSGNAADATAKAALATRLSSQAANAAAAAEGNAMGSTNHARIEQSMASLATAMAAMALFEQAKVAAYTAAGAAARAAAATLASLEKVTAMYTSTRQYYMLDDLAETSTQAKRTIALCKEAVSGWAQYSMQGRQTALGAAKQAMDSADTCHKELMAVFKTHA